MKFTLLILIHLCFGYVSVAQSQLTLQEAWRRVTLYPLIQQRALAIEASKIDLEITKKQLSPTVSGQYSNSLNIGRSIDPYTNSFLTQSILGNNYGLAANYTLFDNKQIKNQIEANSLYLKSLNLEKEITENELKYQVLLAFSEVLLAKEQLKISQALVTSSEESLSYYQKLYDADRIRYANLLSLEAENLRLIADSEQAEFDLQRANQKLYRFLGESSGREFELSIENRDLVLKAYPVPLENLLDRALFQSVDFRNFNFQKEIKNRKSAMILSSKWPTISAFSNLGTTYSSAARRLENNELLKINYPKQFFENLNMNVGIVVRVPIFNVSNYELRNQKIKIEIRDINSRVAAKKREMRGVIEEAFVRLTSLLQRDKRLKERIETLETINRINQKGFEEGRVAFSEYLQSNRDLEQARFQVNSFKYQYFVYYEQLTFYQNGSWQ